MFDLEKREKFIILFLIIILIAGLSVRLYQKSNQIIDVRIRPLRRRASNTNMSAIIDP